MSWTTVILDNFTDTQFTALSSHTIAPTNTGGYSWTVDAGNMQIATGGATVGAAGASRASISGSLAADHAVSIKHVTTDVDTMLWVRYAYNAGSTDGYRLLFDAGGVVLRRVAGGSVGSTINSATYTAAVNDVFRVEIVGTTITVKRNGGTLFTEDISDDGTVFTGGTVALWYDHTNDGYGDDFTVETWSVGGGGDIIIYMPDEL